MRRVDLLIGPDETHRQWAWETLQSASGALAEAGVQLFALTEGQSLLPDTGGQVIVTGPLWGQVSHGQAIAELAARFAGDDLHAHAFVQDPALMAALRFAQTVPMGRVAPPERDKALLQQGSWRVAVLKTAAALPHGLADPEAPPLAADLTGFAEDWTAGLGAGHLHLHGAHPGQSAQDHIDTLWTALDLTVPPPEAEPPWASLPTAQTLARMIAFSPVLTRYLALRDWQLTAEGAKSLRHALGGSGPALSPAPWLPLSAAFAPARAALPKAFPDLPAAALLPPKPTEQSVLDPGEGFRATQYLAALAPRIERQRMRSSSLPTRLHATLADLRRSGLTPRRQKVKGPKAPFDPSPGPPTGTTIVACMKNEAPFILEWIAHHRAIGVDRFVIYTNGCSDGTEALLARLEVLGLVDHRTNEHWKGKSPQQHALNLSLHEPAVRGARWVLHIDVDEFVNVKCGDGTLSALFEALPGATHIALTWRLFGHSGVARYQDDLVCEQFTRCAPAYCPKPHSAWGIKTLGRNMGAYEKLGCHRPNKLRSQARRDVHWVNGSGQDISADLAERGWRSNRASIGYDLVQLNHYALRSAESFLVKRDRGRALHVDRDIGLNYWIRMDWSGDRDLSMARHLPRLRGELARLKSDPELAALHDEAVAWHRARAAALREDPKMEALYQEITHLKLDDDERAAWSLALSMES